jgi:gas vesicle protein
MSRQSQQAGGYEFMVGMLAGACVGVGLALWLVPRASKELRERALSTARSLGDQAAEQLDQARASVSEVRDEILERGREVRDDVVDLVTAGASEVARAAAEARGDAQSRRRPS